MNFSHNIKNIYVKWLQLKHLRENENRAAKKIQEKFM